MPETSTFEGKYSQALDTINAAKKEISMLGEEGFPQAMKLTVELGEDLSSIGMLRPMRSYETCREKTKDKIFSAGMVGTEATCLFVGLLIGSVPLIYGSLGASVPSIYGFAKSYQDEKALRKGIESEVGAERFDEKYRMIKKLWHSLPDIVKKTGGI
jgi:hypothetical protein